MKLDYNAIYKMVEKEYASTPSQRLQAIVNILPSIQSATSRINVLGSGHGLNSDDSLDEGLYTKSSSGIIYKLSM